MTRSPSESDAATFSPIPLRIGRPMWYQLTTYLRDVRDTTRDGWNRFWFTPVETSTVCLLRILTGLMVCDTHLVWWSDSAAFFGSTSWQDRSAVSALGRDGYTWSHLWYCGDGWSLHLAHALALCVFVMFTLGWQTRVSSILSFLLVVSYAHRVPMALYGLDQVNAMLTMYLMLSPCGQKWSLDAWQAARHRPATTPSSDLPDASRLNPSRLGASSLGANIATRLIQVHLCVIYFFAGISKLQGPAWWDGTALWKAVANLEYQSLDCTGLVHWPMVVNLLTHFTVAWEITYPALVWPRLTRPLIVAGAIPLHLGIALALGMPTFGLAMLIANVVWISPTLVQQLLPFSRQCSSLGTSTAATINTSRRTGPHLGPRPRRHVPHG